MEIRKKSYASLYFYGKHAKSERINLIENLYLFLSCYNKYVFLNHHLKNLTGLFLLLCLFVCLFELAKN